MDIRVLVVGAGPVGLTMAAELARYGVSVRIVDKAATRTDKSKALVLWSRTLELLEGAACSETFVAAGRKVYVASIFAGNRQMAHIDLTGVDSTYAYALMLPQSETERLLETHLEGLGVRVERGVEVTGFLETATGVEANLRHADGSSERASASWLVGCDGAHSVVRHGLSAKFEGDTLQSDWVLADGHLEGWPLPETELAMYWCEDGVLGVFPILPGRFRVIADVGDATGPRAADPSLEQIQAIIDRRGPGGVTLTDAVWLSGFRINERKVAAYRKGRVFLTGDAAHVHSPAGGQGMNTGMQDAFNLAWKLALVCRGALPAEPLLDSYSVERSAVGEKVLADAGRLTWVATLRNPLAQAVRNMAVRILLGLPPVHNIFAGNFSEIAIGYKRSPLNGPYARGVGAPAPGRRVRMFPARPPVGAGNIPRFALCAKAGAEVDALIAAYPLLLEPQPWPPFRADSFCLVRPDGYVACAVKDIGSIGRYLSALGGT